jgi:SAM-dependent methyltransferase/uncharacterized protein YbaR (Trm112 family)
MRLDTLDLLRCPYCGARLTLDSARPHRHGTGDVTDGILRCYCSEFPVVSGIPVLTVEGMSEVAREQIEAGNTAAARRSMLGLDDEAASERFEEICRSETGTYREAVDALGPEFAENRYFLYRFSDPTFLVADTIVRALGSLVLEGGGRAVDLCGGSGHLTRSLQRVSTQPPVLMDWTFAKLVLAQRFTAPGAEVVCADAHAPLPFAPATFSFAVCSDAFHYIWTKALLAREMMRIIDAKGIAALTHAHNARQENPSPGMPLPPDGYREVFEGLDVRLYSERALLADVMDGHVDLSRHDDENALASDPAITAVATARPDVFVDRAPARAIDIDSELRLNPLYDVSVNGRRATLRLQFPSEEYEHEYAACRRYLPDLMTIDAGVLDALSRGDAHPDLQDLEARRIVLHLPHHYA